MNINIVVIYINQDILFCGCTYLQLNMSNTLRMYDVVMMYNLFL